MATSDKHCQTFNVISETDYRVQSLQSECERCVNSSSEYVRGMYDETVPVLNAREIESPSNSDEEEVVRAAMAKFNPPVRHTARHDFDSDSDSGSERKFLGNVSGEEESPDRNKSLPEKILHDKFEIQKQASKETIARSKPTAKDTDSSNSESDSGDVEGDNTDILSGSGRKRGGGVVIPAEGAYDPKQFQDLKVPPDMENIFQYIMKYTPQKIDIEFKLQPFVPEYMPAVGDIDAFIKVATPACNVRGQPLPEPVLEHIDNLGLLVLDEPSSEQSDSALLHLQLRALSKTHAARSTLLTKKVENAEKNSKAIERWIKDVSELHLSKPPPTVMYTSKMPDIDNLMEEWPETMEETLNEVGFPAAGLDCSLSQYVELVCGVFDVPIVGDGLAPRIQALHLLFSLYSAVKNSQLYAERQKEKEDVS
ncbi:unnamed protein product [Diatraea saccharalis]|uniref:Intraflagellar transport protein 46 homolog n=1 Tax=Diatraea saccharalis TaxID=40085 RepID=A0A9N9R4M9_9NEOP|nr:unnamed protein product [Diatraea saccharalis]